MKPETRRLASFFTFFVVLILLMADTTVGGSDEQIDWDNVPPSVIHQKMWEAKATAMMDKQFVRRLAARSPVECTQTNYDVLFYDVDIRVDDTTEILYGVVKFVALAAEDGVGEVQVDFFWEMSVDSVVAPAGALSYSRAGDVVTVVLDQTYNSGEQFEFDFCYHGHPTEGGFQAFSFSHRSSGAVISSLSEPYYARTWWPCKDRMDDKADSFNIAITVDTSFYVASNGTLDSTVHNDDNSHTFFYSVRYPMVTYLFSVAISKYTVWYDEWIYNDGLDTMPIVHAVYPDKYDYSLGKYDITPYALTVYSDNYGLYPFVNEKYGHANFQWGGAMEHQTMSSMSGSNFGFSEPVVVHEMSHQWWGDMITCESWGHIWLNEGWASYSEALYYLEKEGWTRYHSYMGGMDYTGGGTIYVYDTTSVWNIFHGGLSYDKGAWVCHMLRGALGDSLFFVGIDAYYNSEHQHGSATTEEFRDVFETATGWELDWFFEQWIYGTYRPYYRYAVYQEPSDTGGYDVFLVVRQTQTTNPQVFTMPVDFVFRFATLPEDSVTLFVDERRELFKLNFPQMLYGLDLDPADWILKYQAAETWHLYIVTLDEELSDAVRYQYYTDTIETRGATSTTVSVTGGSLPDGFSIDNAGIISGTSSDSGWFYFTVRFVDDGSLYSDEGDFSLYVAAGAALAGDIDLSGQVDIADLLYLVEYEFNDGPAPELINLADVDGSCEVDVADVLYLVEYEFNQGPEPVIGCVE